MERPDPVLLENTREWVARAREDLEAAAYMLTAPAPFVRSALFHCQQAAEKAMKALLTWHDCTFRVTHNLLELGEACAEIDPSLTAEVQRVAVLTKYAARFRYPGAPYEPTVQEAEGSLAVARGFVEVVLKILPSEAGGRGG